MCFILLKSSVSYFTVVDVELDDIWLKEDKPDNLLFHFIASSNSLRN